MASRTALTILALILLIAAREGRAEAYPSTYEPLPSEPLLITNATVLTGTGERIDGGSLLLQDGRIAAVGENLEAPEGVATLDAENYFGVLADIGPRAAELVALAAAAAGPAGMVGGQQRDLDAEGADVDAAAERTPLSAALIHGAARALAELRPEQQAALKISIYEGLPHAEIAQRLAMPLGTVKTHLRRARLTLAEALARRNQPEVES